MNNKLKIPIWWRVFALTYLQNGGNATQAYIKAKPHVSHSTAEAEGSKLLGNPKFLQALNQEKQKMNEMLDINLQQWLGEILWVAMQRPEGTSVGNKLRALELLGKVKGYLPFEKADLPNSSENHMEELIKSIPMIKKAVENKLIDVSQIDVERLATEPIDED